MAKHASQKYTFDGTCDLSNDADIALKFEDESTLFAHSLILRKASPTLYQLLQEDNKSIELHSSSKEVWIDILTDLYPAVHSSMTSRVLSQDFDGLLAIGEECVKYEIFAVLGSMDEILNCMILTLPSSRTAVWSPVLGPIARIASILKLKKSRKTAAERVFAVMAETKKTKGKQLQNSCFCLSCEASDFTSGSDPNQGQSYSGAMLNAIKDLYSNGDDEWNTWLSRQMMTSVFNASLGFGTTQPGPF